MMLILRVAVVASVMALAAACGSDDGMSSQTSAGEPAASATGEEGSLEGTWRTGPVTQDDMAETLRSHDLGRWIGEFQEVDEDPPDETVFELVIADGRWDLFGEMDGLPSEPVDYDATYEVDGDTVIVSHEGDSNTYRWDVEGDTLAIEWLDTTYPDHQGIPEEVFQRAFYMSRPFERQT